MTQIAVVYGKAAKTEAEKKTDLRVINIADRHDMAKLGQDDTYFCLGQAYTLARRHLPVESITLISKLDELPGIELSEEEAEGKPAVAVAGPIVVANKYHSRVDDSGAWLSSYHVELIERLLSDNFKVEILDASNNPIVVLEG